MFAICASGVALCATHYLCYAGMVTAVVVDYLMWGRKSARLSWRTIIVIAATHDDRMLAIADRVIHLDQLKAPKPVLTAA